MPKILYVARDDGGCGYYRCVQPAKFLNRLGLASAEVVLNHPTQEQLLSADLVIMQDMGTENSGNIARQLIQNHIPFLAEFDDFVHHVSPNNLGGYPSWNPGTLYIHRSMEMARSAFGIQVSTNQLAREYYPYNPTIFVVPNYFDKDLWISPISKKQDGKIRIGWAGGNAHADDLAMVSKVIDKIVRESDGKVLFETFGMTKNELGGVFSLNELHQECPSCGYEGEIHHYPGESLEEFPLILASKGWDIALAPVVNNSFGNCKSDNKIKEYAACGIPIVASPITPYKESDRQGARVLFAETFEEWYNQIVSLIESPERRDTIARSNREWMSGYWISDHIQEIFEVYSKIIARARAVFPKKTDKQ